MDNRTIEQRIADGDLTVVRDGDNFTITIKTINRHTGQYEGTQSITRTVADIEKAIEEWNEKKAVEDALCVEKIRKVQDPDLIAQAVADLERIRSESNALFDKYISEEEYLLGL